MFNKVILVGNLTRDPELKYTTGGVAVCEFSIAVNEKYKDREEVYFGNIVVFGKSGENCNKYLLKGSSCLVEGKLRERKWEANGETKRKTEILASNVRFLGSKGKAAPEQTELPVTDETELEPF